MKNCPSEERQIVVAPYRHFVSLTKSALITCHSESDLIKSRAIAMTANDPALGMKIISMLPEGETMTFADLKKGWVEFGRPNRVFKLVGLLNSPDERATFLVETFRTLPDQRLNVRDYEIIAHQLESLGLTGDAAVQTREALDAARAASLGKQ